MIPLSQHIDHLQRQLKHAELRQQVISHNIANVNTPGYKALDLNFSNASAADSSRSGSSPSGEVVERSGAVPRADGNSVDLDQEIAESHKNALLYQTYLQLLAREFRGMQQAMRT